MFHKSNVSLMAVIGELRISLSLPQLLCCWGGGGNQQLGKGLAGGQGKQTATTNSQPFNKTHLCFIQYGILEWLHGNSNIAQYRNENYLWKRRGYWIGFLLVKPLDYFQLSFISLILFFYILCNSRINSTENECLKLTVHFKFFILIRTDVLLNTKDYSD